MAAITGGCLCGAVRYACQQAPVDIGYCHCRMCQRASGAPAVAWASFPLEVFSYTRGAPRTFRSSADAQREFCGDCGSQLLFRDMAEAKSVDINVGALDDPGQVAPRYHIWTESQLAWFEVDDELPRHKQDWPD